MLAKVLQICYDPTINNKKGYKNMIKKLTDRQQSRIDQIIKTQTARFIEFPKDKKADALILSATGVTIATMRRRLAKRIAG
mgnify:CR=1 FL=1